MCDHQGTMKALIRGLDALYEHDPGMLVRRTNERAVTGRLALYLQGEFPDCKVDVEYNRHIDEPKRAGSSLIVPDVVVHSRGNDDQNILAVEVKPFWSARSRDDDWAKLRHLTGPEYQYDLGAHVELLAGSYQVTWFCGGEEAGASGSE